MNSPIKYTPSFPLCDFVDYLYVTESVNHSAENPQIIPSNPYFLFQPHLDLGVSKPNLIGIFSSPFSNEQFGENGPLFGFKLKPYALFSGFSINPIKTANKIRALEFDVNRSLSENIENWNDHESVIQTINQVIFENLRPQNAHFEILEMVDTLLETSISNNSQKDLAAQFERSPKSFIQIFKKTVGVTPLTFLHISKIQHAIALIKSNPSLPLTEIAHELGFFDQAHFIRIFKKHTGITPSMFRTQKTT